MIFSTKIGEKLGGGGGALPSGPSPRYGPAKFFVNKLETFTHKPVFLTFILLIYMYFISFKTKARILHTWTAVAR